MTAKTATPRESFGNRTIGVNEGRSPKSAMPMPVCELCGQDNHDLIFHARKLESDRARLIEALRNLQECVLGYRTTGKPDYKTMSRLEDEARSLLGELEGK